MASVLLVTDRQSVKNSFAPVLEDAGYEVVTCPGPQPPNYLCMGARCGHCPLAALADVVFADADVAGNRVGEGATTEDLVRLYRRMHRPVVLLDDPENPRDRRGDPRVDVVPTHCAALSVLEAVAKVVGRAGDGHTNETEELAGPKRWTAGTTLDHGQL